MLKGFYILIWIIVFKLCFCQQRMGLGNESVLRKKYLVYFVKSPYSEVDDDAWLCAGAIVSPTQILTAAACLVNVNWIYAIAGYKKYVHARDIEKDKCTNTCKKKVVKISVPKEYTAFSAMELEWMNVDIGVATVQEPFTLNDESYLAHCSYVPESININYDKANEVENTRAIALGWGGKKATAETEEKLKPKLLKEATTIIIRKTFCTKLVPENGSKELVEKYLLCASGNGFLGEEADETTSDPILEYFSISNLNNSTKNIDENNEMSSRKSSLLETCQNDHGGPLTTWVGAEEVILGVALNGICNPNFDCVGPRIYISTVATANITKCLLETNHTKRKICNDQIHDKRYQVNDIHIQWPEDLKKINSTSSVSNQKVSSYRRLNNKEETLYVRPTRDIQSYDEPQNLQDNTAEQPQEDIRRESNENQDYTKVDRSRKENFQDERELNTFHEPPSPPQADQTGGPVNKESKNQPQNTQKRFVSKQREPESQPETNNFYQPQPEYQNKPEVDTADQQQMESYYQPPLDPYYNQPPMDSYVNKPQTDSKYLPETEPYYQPQTKPKNEPPVKPNYQNPMDQNDQQMELFNQPSIASQNQPQLNHETKSNNPQPPLINNNQQVPAFEPPQLGPSRTDSYNQPQIESFGQKPLRKPPPEQFNNPPAESGSMISSQPKVKTLSNTQYSNKGPQSSYNNTRIEAFPPEPEESYNPLDIIMANNEEEELTFKPPIEQPFKRPPVERHKLPGADAYMSQSFKPSLDKPFEQPNLSQPLGQSGLAPRQPFDTNHPLNGLRDRQREYATKGEPQTFEQMYSQLHAGPEPNVDGSDPAPTPREETFDEIYRNLHDDGGAEEPLNQEFQPQNDQPIEQEVEQTDARIVNESPVNVEETQDDPAQIQMRQQAPLKFADYKY